LERIYKINEIVMKQHNEEPSWLAASQVDAPVKFNDHPIFTLEKPNSNEMQENLKYVLEKLATIEDSLLKILRTSPEPEYFNTLSDEIEQLKKKIIALRDNELTDPITQAQFDDLYTDLEIVAYEATRLQVIFPLFFD